MKSIDREYMRKKLRDAEHGVEHARVIGINKSVHTCDKCGKEDLAKTYEVQMPGGAVSHFGAECARTVQREQDESEESEYDSEDESEEESDEEIRIPEEIEEPFDLDKYRAEEGVYEQKAIPLSPLPSVADSLSVENFDKRFQIKNVIFDTYSGIGASPNGREVRYLGFAALMKPETFLRLAAPIHQLDEQSLDRLEKSCLNPGWGIPFLNIDTSSGMIIGHEGRHRTNLFTKLNPGELVLVHLFPRGERAKDLTKQKFAKMNAGMFEQAFYNHLNQEQQKKQENRKAHFVKGPLFEELFWMNERLKV